MPSVRIVRHATIAADTAVAATVWSPSAARRIEQLLAPFLEQAEDMPDFELMLKLVGRLLAFHEKQATAIDEKTESYRISAVRLRIRRDEAAKALREELRRARYFFDQSRGKGEGAKLGLGEGLSYKNPRLLVRLGHQIADFLPDFAQKVPTDDRLPSPAALERSIRAKAEDLDQALAHLDPQAENEAVSRIRRRRETRQTERIIRRATTFLAGFYKLCELDDFAKKVRPVFRRPPRRRKGKKGSKPTPSRTPAPET